jgi:hypothetical protein
MAMTQRMVKLADLILDPEVQARVALSDETIAEYASLDGAAAFPPAIVFNVENVGLVVADGWHRYEARKRAGKPDLECSIRTGTKREAILYAVGANGRHGRRPGNVDKRHAVAKLLSDPEWSTWSDNEIAQRCRVSHPLVGQIRAELTAATRVTCNSSSEPPSEPVTCNSSSESPEPLPSSDDGKHPVEPAPAPVIRTHRSKSGRISTMNVANIGKSKRKKTSSEPAKQATKEGGDGETAQEQDKQHQEADQREGHKAATVTSGFSESEEEQARRHAESRERQFWGQASERGGLLKAWEMASEADRKQFSEQLWPEVARLARREFEEGDLIQWIDTKGKELFSKPRRIKRASPDGFNIHVDNGTGGEMSIRITECILIAKAGEWDPRGAETKH